MIWHLGTSFWAGRRPGKKLVPLMTSMEKVTPVIRNWCYGSVSGSRNWSIMSVSGSRNWCLMSVSGRKNSGSRNCYYGSVSGPRNWQKTSVSGSRNWRFLSVSFLDPETDIMDQFLGPETDIMGEGNFMQDREAVWHTEIGTVYGIQLTGCMHWQLK